MDAIDKFRTPAVPEGRAEQIALGVGEAVTSAEDALLTSTPNGLYQFRMRHPWLYGIIAFVLGGGLVAVFTMTRYTNWVYESINLKVALYQVIFGGLAGGIAAVLLAFGFARILRNTLSGSSSTGLIKR